MKKLILLFLAAFLVVGTVELKGNNSISEATTTPKTTRVHGASNAIKKATNIVSNMRQPKVAKIIEKQKAFYSAATIKNATVTTKPVVKKTTTTTAKKSTPRTTTKPVTVSRGSSRADVEATIREVGSQYWTDSAELDALIWVNKHESVRPGVVSRGGCKGLFQLKNPPKWMVLGDAASETKAGCEYIKRRYKTPSRAKAFWQSHHWY